MTTNFNNIIPEGVLFNLKEIQEMHLMKVSMTKKLIYKNEIEAVRIASKLHISRAELIRYLEANTFAIAS
jgi:hypothetical protein